jgi:hypothetical protein
MDADGTALGNYPQAFTHLDLIEAAVTLRRADDRDALQAWAERVEAGLPHRWPRRWRVLPTYSWARGSTLVVRAPGLSAAIAPPVIAGVDHTAGELDPARRGLDLAEVGHADDDVRDLRALAARAGAPRSPPRWRERQGRPARGQLAFQVPRVRKTVASLELETDAISDFEHEPFSCCHKQQPRRASPPQLMCELPSLPAKPGRTALAHRHGFPWVGHVVKEQVCKTSDLRGLSLDFSQHQRPPLVGYHDQVQAHPHLGLRGLEANGTHWDAAFDELHISRRMRDVLPAQTRWVSFDKPCGRLARIGSAQVVALDPQEAVCQSPVDKRSVGLDHSGIQLRGVDVSEIPT